MLTPPTLRIFVAGSLEFVVDRPISGVPIHVSEGSLPGRQGRLVLAMLVVEHGRPVGREELAEELWPDELPDAWDVTLRALISKTRAALAPLSAAGMPEPVAGALGAYRWRMPANAWLDLDEAVAAIHRAEAALGAGKLDAAAGDGLVAAVIAARPFLAGVESPWIGRQRGRLLEVRRRALDCTGEVWLQKGDYGEATRQTNRLLELDPYHEPAVRRLMRAAAAGGNRAEVVRTFERFQRRLHDELGVEPATATIDLRQQLLGR